MFKDDFDMEAEDERRGRLAGLQENQGWIQDVRPFLIARLEAAITAIRYEEDMTHWKGVGIEAHIEEFMKLVEGEKWQSRVVEPQKANPKENPKASLKDRIANFFRG